MPLVKLADFRGMELVTELFVARRESLLSTFPGWLRPLPAPVRRHLHNPFTHEAMFRDNGDAWLVDTCEPEGPWPAETQCPRLEAFDRVSLRPIRDSELSALGRLLPTPVSEDFVAALFAPPSNGWFLWAVPDPLSRALAFLSSPQHVAQAWASLLHSSHEFDAEEYALIGDWDTLLGSIVAIARRAVSDRRASSFTMALNLTGNAA